jgi:hypothetical protein
MTRPALTFAPRLLPAAEAARYLGISETTLRGIGLPRRVLGAKRLYDIRDLDAYVSDLPVEGESSTGGNTCDQAWGTTA